MAKTQSYGKIGIYFFVGKEILIEAVPLSQGEKTEIAIDHKGSHYDYWENLDSKTPAEKKFKSSSYDAFPRGRVLFRLKENKFIIFRDRCIKEAQISIIKEKFGLNDSKCIIEYDAHYKCSRCNPYFAD